MILEHLRLFNFRCYEVAELTPDPKFNIISGLNGQGKTSILEAIGLLAFLKSFRNARNSETLRINSLEGSIIGKIANQGLDANLAVKLWSNKKQATFNGKTCRYLSDYIGKISAVTFSPTDLEIIRGYPDYRRQWVDRLALSFDPSHADLVARFQKVLIQRNKLLRAYSERRISKLPDDFEIWTDELCTWGAKVIHNRIHSVDKAVDSIRHFYYRISRQEINISIYYQSEIFDEVHYRQLSQSSSIKTDRALRESIAKSLSKDLIMGSTSVGPHKDDLKFEMAGNLVKSFGSQGEIRSLVLAMRLAEIEIAKNVRKLNPILLIDDFSSELDAMRRKFLLDYLLESNSQVFITTTEELDLGRRFSVVEGRIGPI